MAASLFRLLVFMGIMGLVLGSQSSPPEKTYLRHQRRAMEKPYVYKRTNGTSSALTTAQKLVDDAVAQQSEYNTYRVAHPRRNNYYASDLPSPKSVAKKAKTRRDQSEPLPPKLNDTIRAAAALLAEHHAAQQRANGTLHRPYRKPSHIRPDDASNLSKRDDDTTYWVANITHTGMAPMGQNSSWVVYRDVTDPKFAGGAKGDGVTDDTKAINAAISYGGNCGDGCLSSSTKGTLIYFPPGTYLISTPIEAYYYSQLVGNPLEKPIIKTAPKFIGLGAIETDVYEPNANGNEWYINQSNFYRQVRNLIIDIQDTTTASVAGLHWQVAQATSLTNVDVYASAADNTTSMGMFTENGSSGFMSDCFFESGAYGLYGGNQQYTVRSFEFVGQQKASIALLWDWGWTWSQLFITESPVGILLINPEDPTGQQAGSIYVMDTMFDSVNTAILANAPSSTILESSVITLDNIAVSYVKELLSFSDGSSLIPAQDVSFIIVGNAEADGYNFGAFSVDVATPSTKLTSSDYRYYRDSYFFKSRPQYGTLYVDDFINVKDLGAKGDGVSDDTSSIAKALSMATETNVIYFPAGSYIITDTLELHAGTRITGAVWSQLVASGDKFGDALDPQPMLRVGSEGEVGLVEITDMLFTSIGALPGLVMVEWNMGPDGIRGSAAMWDSHFRVGGAAGTKLQVADCPKGAPIQDGCVAASMMMHVTSGATGYFENVWAWVADHDLDDPTNTMISVAVARGILDESSEPTWYYGTASEHSMLYQYNFHQTTNTFAGMIQTESPYFQYTTNTESPGDFFRDSIGIFSNDPVFPDDTCSADDLLCNFSWAVMIYATTNLTISGAGLYSWFDNYDQSVCVDSQNCQQRLLNNQGSNNQLYIWNLVTIGSVEMLSDTESGTIIYAANNTQAVAHPFWSILGAYLDDYAIEPSFCSDNDTDQACFVAPVCDYSLSYDTLEDLDAASGSWPAECTNYYALGTLNSLLAAALDNYTAVNDGYDSVWKYYVESVKNMVPAALNEFMAPSTWDTPEGGPGNKFFSCVYKEELSGDGPITYDPCPPPHEEVSFVDKYDITFTLKDENGFDDALSSTYGIQKDWIIYGNERYTLSCDAGSVGGGNIDRRYDFCEGYAEDIRYYGIPKASDNFTVTNPKDVITKAWPTLGVLQDTILGHQMDLMIGQWTGPSDDILQVASMPVFLIVQAISSMADAKARGEEQKKEDEKALVLEILGIVFAFIPFLDEFGPELDFLDGVVAMIDAAGNIGLAIQGIIDHPENAPMEILGALTGGVTKREDDMAKLAKTRRGISSDDLAKIGTSFKSLDDKFQSIIKRCL